MRRAWAGRCVATIYDSLHAAVLSFFFFVALGMVARGWTGLSVVQQLTRTAARMRAASRWFAAGGCCTMQVTSFSKREATLFFFLEQEAVVLSVSVLHRRPACLTCMRTRGSRESGRRLISRPTTELTDTQEKSGVGSERGRDCRVGEREKGSRVSN